MAVSFGRDAVAISFGREAVAVSFGRDAVAVSFGRDVVAVSFGRDAVAVSFGRDAVALLVPSVIDVLPLGLDAEAGPLSLTLRTGREPAGLCSTTAPSLWYSVWDIKISSASQ